MVLDTDDFPLVVNTIRTLTLAQAKSLIKDINNGQLVRIPVSGNKPEIIARIIARFQEVKEVGQVHTFATLRELLTRYKQPPSNIHTNGAASIGGVPASKVLGADRIPNYGAYAGPSTIAPAPPAPAARPATSSTSTARVIFQRSPFWSITQFLCTPGFCPEAPNNMDRKSAVIFVTLSAAHVQLLQTPEYQVRLFCTTYEAQAASLSGRNPAPLEFPLICDCIVNGTPLSVNLRGSRKKPGRVGPPNLNKDKALVIREGRPNRIELNYGAVAKRHILVAALCQMTSVETLVARVRQRQVRTKQDVLSRMRKEAEDDDIEAGAATMSLKCPLSYMRIVTPCRSSACPHAQCFDAYSFFSINEQTPSWTCPVCNRDVKADDLIMDGYVDDILSRVPQDEEYVVVEPDGSWQTPDGAVTSAGFTTQPTSKASTPMADRSAGALKAETPRPFTDHTPVPNEIVLLDTPSPKAVAAQVPPPETRYLPWDPRTAAPLAILPDTTASTPLEPLKAKTASNGAETRASGTASPIVIGDVIDLTLDSDDDEPPPVPSVLSRPAFPSVAPARPQVPSNAARTSLPSVLQQRPSSSSGLSAQPSVPSRPSLPSAINRSPTMPTLARPSSSAVPPAAPAPALRSPLTLSSALPRAPAPASATTPTTPQTPQAPQAPSGLSAVRPASALPRTGPTTTTNGHRDSTPEDEQIRRPGKRPRVGEHGPPTDPRLQTDSAPAASPSRLQDVVGADARPPTTTPARAPTDPRTHTNGAHKDKPADQEYYDDDTWWTPGK